MPRIVDHQQRRNALAEVAALLIAEVGLEKTTIRNIARKSGYSKGIIEHYFDGKDDLIASALNWLNQRYTQRVTDEIGTRQGLAALRIRLEQTLPLSEHSIQEWKVRLRFWSLAAIDPRFQKEQSRRWQAARDAFTSDLEHARMQGVLPSTITPEQAADHLLFLTTGLSAAALHSPDSISTHQLKHSIDQWLAELTRLPGRGLAESEG